MSLVFVAANFFCIDSKKALEVAIDGTSVCESEETGSVPADALVLLIESVGVGG